MLKLYKFDKELGTFSEYSHGDDTTNLIRSVFNGQDGGTVIQQLYIRNDNPDYWYSEIILGFGPTEKVRPNNLRGFSYKLLYGEVQPLTQEWASIDSGNNLDYRNNGLRFKIPDIGMAGTADQKYYPLWLRIDVPPKTPMGVVLDTYLGLDFQESLL